MKEGRRLIGGIGPKKLNSNRGMTLNNNNIHSLTQKLVETHLNFLPVARQTNDEQRAGWMSDKISACSTIESGDQVVVDVDEW